MHKPKAKDGFIFKFGSWLGKSFLNPGNLPNFLSAAFTLLLAVFAFYAWKESQRNTHALEGQLKQMVQAERPWVGFDVSAGKAKPGEILYVTFAIRNDGKSPATKVHASFRDGVLKLNSEDGVAECRGCSEGLLLPGSTIKFPMQELFIPTDTTGKYPVPAVFGRVDYEDTSGNKYWTTACRYYEIAFQALANCPAGDETGDSR